MHKFKKVLNSAKSTNVISVPLSIVQTNDDAPKSIHNKNSYIVYPNPCNTDLYITKKVKYFKIINTNGKIVLKLDVVTANQSIDVSKLPKGIYIVQGSNKQHNIIQQIIIE
jgi:Secretion system C-terminal sorting domain